MHMVVFTTAEGRPGYHQTEALDDAIRFVERVCNMEGVSNVKLYRMSEVPLEVKAVYKVEVAGAGQAESSAEGMPALPSMPSVPSMRAPEDSAAAVHSTFGR